MILALLKWLGLRSKCCGADIWEWDYNKRYCTECDKAV